MHPKLILTMNQAFCYETVRILRRFDVLHLDFISVPFSLV
jgi:hypothetical protein